VDWQCRECVTRDPKIDFFDASAMENYAYAEQADLALAATLRRLRIAPAPDLTESLKLEAIGHRSKRVHEALVAFLESARNLAGKISHERTREELLTNHERRVALSESVSAWELTSRREPRRSDSPEDAE